MNTVLILPGNSPVRPGGYLRAHIRFLSSGNLVAGMIDVEFPEVADIACAWVHRGQLPKEVTDLTQGGAR